MVSLVALFVIGLQERDPVAYQKLDYATAATVPFTTPFSQTPVVEVTLADGNAYHFDLDTGAAGPGMLDSDIAEKLGLKESGEIEMGDPSGKNNTKSKLYALPSLRLGGLTYHDLTVVGGHLRPSKPGMVHIDGVIGLAMYKEMLLRIDYQKHEITFSKESMPGDIAAKAVDVSFEDSVPSIYITLPSGDLKAHIDSGSMGGLLVPEKTAANLKFIGEPKVVGHARTLFNSFDIHAGRLDGNIQIAGADLKSPMVEFADMFPVANIGSRVLRNFTIYLDQRINKVAFVASGPVDLALKN